MTLDIDQSYYRYYGLGSGSGSGSGAGSAGKLKYAFGGDAYARLVAALGTGVDSLTDAQVDDYADTYLQYDSSGRATSVTNGARGAPSARAARARSPTRTRPTWPEGS
ncbi:unnamed protein product [Gemmata massiliana]|uniref:Uncharacterized protein n=1 Tax=Gemmata massiliana TaxID=1210884 RepID=A0A6P2D5U2_9BACT|nr:hypothetical protein [Gemmata massiliana]VTR96661.1 unnamed protein product [Gemmata massiliana]